MKASEADKFKIAPSLPDLEVSDTGAHAHGGHDHGGGPSRRSMESVRTASHCGHEIVIKTSYDITVNGQSLAAHLSVNDDGSLHTHALPEYAFSSAVDVVKKIIDAFPDEFPCDDGPSHDHGGDASSSDQQGHGHGSHTHEHP
jgi:hypothetical protein